MKPDTFGVVGYGHFGKFLSKQLSEFGDVYVTDIDRGKLPRRANGVRAAHIDEVAQKDVVILAVPFPTLSAAVGDLRPHLNRDAVVMDVVSTKERATGVLQDILDGHENVLATHPLFGPPSMRHIKGERLVVTYTKGERSEELKGFFADDVGLQVVEVDADEHDRAMAYFQALPFFIARALVDVLNQLAVENVIPDLPNLLDPAQKSILALPSFDKLATIAAIETHHSDEMFDTTQHSNPFASHARKQFLEALTSLNNKLESEPEFSAGSVEIES